MVLKLTGCRQPRIRTWVVTALVQIQVICKTLVSEKEPAGYSGTSLGWATEISDQTYLSTTIIMVIVPMIPVLPVFASSLAFFSC